MFFEKRKCVFHLNTGASENDVTLRGYWVRRVSSVWWSARVFPYVTDDCVKKHSIIHIARTAWHSFSYPVKSLFLVWLLFFRLTTGIIRLKALACCGTSTGFVSQENVCQSEESFLYIMVEQDLCMRA